MTHQGLKDTEEGEGTEEGTGREGEEGFTEG